MSNDEIKVLMLELSEHLNKATAIINQLHTNYIEDGRTGADILAARIDRNSDEPFKAKVQCDDLIEVMQTPMEVRERNCDTYPFENVSNINGVEFFELCARRNEVQLNEAV